jgi:hypothetical protein
MSNTLYLSKSLLYLKLSQEYVDFFLQENTGNPKAHRLFAHYRGRMDWILKDMDFRVGDEVKEAYRRDIQNASAIDSLANNYITLSEEGRNLLEAYSEELRKTHKLK